MCYIDTIMCYIMIKFNSQANKCYVNTQLGKYLPPLFNEWIHLNASFWHFNLLWRLQTFLLRFAQHVKTSYTNKKLSTFVCTNSQSIKINWISGIIWSEIAEKDLFIDGLKIRFVWGRLRESQIQWFSRIERNVIYMKTCTKLTLFVNFKKNLPFFTVKRY